MNALAGFSDADLLRLHDDPVFYARVAFDLEPTEQQRAFLDAVKAPGAHVAVRSGHGVGKSSALAMAALWFLDTHRDALVPCTAPTAHQLNDILWRELAGLHRRMPDIMRDEILFNAERIRRKGSNGAIIPRTARPENPDALQGFHAPEILFIVDEASGVNDAVFEVARGALSTPGARVALAGNPTRLSGYFHGAFHLSRDNWTRLQFSCLDSPLVDPAYPREIAAEYGEDSDMYRVRVLGDFPKSGIFNLIPLEWVERAMGKEVGLDFESGAPGIIGVDPAWLGDDRSAVVYRRGKFARKLFAGRGLDTIRLADVVAREAERLEPDAIFIDQTGVGAGVVDQLKVTRHPVAGVAFSQQPLEPERFVNRRAEMWWKLREWMEHGAVVAADADLRADLIAPEYFFTDAGKIQLESKDSMRKRGLPSPDLGDALALTFAMPVRKASAAPRQNTYAANFDPYAGLRRR